jgi:hypothetical protein
MILLDLIRAYPSSEVVLDISSTNLRPSAEGAMRLLLPLPIGLSRHDVAMIPATSASPTATFGEIPPRDNHSPSSGSFSGPRPCIEKAWTVILFE